MSSEVRADFRVGPDVVDGAADHFFEMREELFEGDEGEFGFDVRVLGEVAAGEGFLGAEGFLDAEDVAEGGEAGFEIELGGLGEVGLGVGELVWEYLGVLGMQTFSP